jgi:hypothetical protein
VKITIRSILFSSAWLIVTASAFGAGEYQPAKDGKTMVWNGTPKAGESVSWSGDRDKENYASGFGDLTWYNSTGKVYALYYGNMVRGKFEGAVNVHSNGHTAHAYFVGGDRVTGWARGAAPAKMDVPPEAITEKRKEADRAAAPKREIAKERTEAGESPKPAAKKPKVENVVVTTPKPAASTPEPTTELTPERSAITSSETSTPEPLKEETPPVVAEKRIEPETTASPPRVFDEPTALPKIATAPAPSVESEKQQSASDLEKLLESHSSPRSTPEPSPSAFSENAPPSNEPVAKTTPRDVSVNSLVGPPSSLRTNSVPENVSEKSESSESAPTIASGPLVESQATNLANKEARVQGYNLDNYEAPKVDHSEVKGKWVLFYSLKKGENGSDLPPTLSITVEDKTRKVEIRK